MCVCVCFFARFFWVHGFYSHLVAASTFRQSIFYTMQIHCAYAHTHAHGTLTKKTHTELAHTRISEACGEGGSVRTCGAGTLLMREAVVSRSAPTEETSKCTRTHNHPRAVPHDQTHTYTRGWVVSLASLYVREFDFV